MKKNIAMRVASLVLMCTIVTSCFVSSTFAKYTSSASGSDSVTVAKWAIKVNNNDITQTDTVTFNLFDTIMDSNVTSEEEDVVDGKIAPGTSGSFTLAIQNASEVTTEYDVKFTLPETDIPFEYSLDGTNWDSTLGTSSNTLAIGASTNVKVYWRWAFESGDDANDTSIGIAAETVNVTATITATQLD